VTRRLWPRSLLGRTILVLLLGVLASNLAGLAVYSGDRLDVALGARSRQIAQQVAAAADEIEGLAPPLRRQRLREFRQPGLRLAWGRRPWSSDDLSGWRNRLVRRAFLDELGTDAQVRLRLSMTDSAGPAGPGPRAGRPFGRGGVGDDAGDEGDGEGGKPPHMAPMASHRSPWMPPAPPSGAPELRLLTGSWQLGDGTWLNFAAPVASFPPFWRTPMFFVLLASMAVVLAASVWAVRRATQPLAMLGEAAERFGRDVHAPALAEAGPLEVERAARAFNRMQERLQRLIRDRTQMLAAISHDLRTPLTRLRLRAELIEDEEQQRKTVADLEEMRAMIAATLAFARDEAAVEDPAPLDLAVLLQTVCDEAADGGADVTFAGPEHARCFGRPAALKRAFANLVENAVRYGGCARAGLAVEPHQLRVDIDDDGPGVPESELERVFQPFYRLETSRSRETGGVGLGLALVRAAIDAHGGRVALTNRPGGGLRATVLLPLPRAGSA